MSEFLVGVAVGLVAALLAAAELAARRSDREHSEIERLRQGLTLLKNSSREPRIQAFAARVLDPEGDEAGA